MFVVALGELAGDRETEAAAIAQLLDLAPYDVKVRLTGTLPRILLQSTSEKDARRAFDGLRAQGHRPLICDTRAVVPNEQMVALRRFAFDETGIWAHGREGDWFRFQDLGAIVVFKIRTSVVRVSMEVRVDEEGDRVEVEKRSNERVFTLAAYLLPKPGLASRRPWVLEEQTARYFGLGPKMRATSHENFLVTVNLLREVAPHAVFDYRFVKEPQSAEGLTIVSGNQSAPASMSGVNLDVMVHLLGHWLMRNQGGPYRG